LTGPDSACSAFDAPPYAVAGKTRYDQQWIDTTTETIVEGCGKKRPRARPVSLDAKPMIVKAPVSPNAQVNRRWWPL
jgi:hypothetical protein